MAVKRFHVLADVWMLKSPNSPAYTILVGGELVASGTIGSALEFKSGLILGELGSTQKDLMRSLRKIDWNAPG